MYSPTGTTIYRLPNDDCYAYTENGTRVVMAFWDWCCQEVMLQNYVEDGFSIDLAETIFWNDVVIWGIEHGLDIPSDAENFAVNNTEDVLDERTECTDFLCDYFYDIGFTEASCYEDPLFDGSYLET